MQIVVTKLRWRGLAILLICKYSRSLFLPITKTKKTLQALNEGSDYYKKNILRINPSLQIQDRGEMFLP